MLKRYFALVFLSLYLYNIVGYLVIFSYLQYRVRCEVKQMLKASFPVHDLTTFAFQNEGLANDRYPLQWVDDHEFRYSGKMYDIVRSHISGDSTYFTCINDTQEEQLFEHLDNQVQRNMADSGQPSKLDAFKDVFKDSLARFHPLFARLVAEASVVPAFYNGYISIEPDTPFLPPRSVSI